MSVFVDNAVPQFENVNGLRKFPFSEDSSLVDRDGKELPQDAVVDLHMVVPADEGSVPDVRLVSAHLSRAMVSVCFRSVAAGRTCAMSVMVAGEDFAPYRPYMLRPLYGSEDIGGVVTFGDMDLTTCPMTYFLEDAVVHPCCIAQSRPAGLRGIVDPRSGGELFGDARLSFSGHVESVIKDGMFSLSLSEESRANLASECAGGSEAGMCGATPIASINGVRPDADGNIVLWFH